MLTSDTKRHIDAARQVLVGIVPDPKGQIDQITNALIYKFMDDMDQASLRVKGGKASFFTGNLEMYAWTRLMDPRLGNQDRMNLYVEALAKFGEAKQLPPLFRDIFKRAFLPFRDPETLGLFLKEIAYFDYSHSEELGNAYEYLLSIMGSQGDAGQFRTPRHIIDFIVAAVDPTKDDTVLDPACGTAGFLISAYKHIVAKHDGKDESGKPNKETPLTPDERKRLMEHFEGYDISPDMVRMSQVNMYLHAFKNPKIFDYNTLASEDRWNDKFDVILANPPFMSPKGGVRPHQRFSVESSRAEVLFVDYIMNHLKPRGRAGVIVPEGIIFQSGIAYKQLRKNLVDDGLYAVVSLPSGVFQPYSGVKTSILFLDKEMSKRNREILFVSITHDGTDLGTRKRATEANDFPVAMRVIEQYKNGEFKETSIAHVVSKERIAESGDYNLSGDRYKIMKETQSKFEMIALGELLQEESERVRGKTDTEIWSVSNKDGFVLSSEYFDKQVASLDTSNYKVIKPNYFAYNPSRINVGSLAHNTTTKTGAVSPMYVVFSIKESGRLLSSYLRSLLKSEIINSNILQLAQGAVRQQLRYRDMEIIKIPLPPLEIQQQIVAELDGYAAIIAGAKQVTENWKPKIDIDPTWEKKELGELLQRVSEQIDPKTRKGEVYYVGLENIESGSGTIVGSPLSTYGEIKSLKNAFKKGDILYGKLRPNLNKVWLADRDGICSTDILVFKGTKDALANFYWYLMLTQGFVDEVMMGIKGAQLPRVGYEHLKNILLPLPPLEIQRQIIEQIEAERTLVESNKKLIAIYEQKTKDTIAKLWSE